MRYHVACMSSAAPTIILIGGPNGAGKSTIAPSLLNYLGVDTFVNADVIAQGLSAFNAESRAFEAGRILLREVHRMAEHRETFAFETTLASRTFSPWIARLIDDGYEFVLCYVWVRSVEVAVRRVSARVRAGGHHIPEEVIRRRWSRSINNFWNLYLPIAHRWYVYDNSGMGHPIRVANGGRGSSEQIFAESHWRELKEASS